MSEPLFVEAQTVHKAWNAVAERLAAPGVQGIDGCQVLVSEGPGVAEIGETERALDLLLNSKGKAVCRAVSKSIYPMKDPLISHAEALNCFLRMRRVFKERPKKFKNSYFARFLDLGPDGVGQIGRLIAVINSGNHRGSALVLTAWQPDEDLNCQRQRGFPCLNSIHVSVHGKSIGLRGVYPLQYAIPKLYGNLLGLRALGLHIASNTGTSLTAFSCYATVEKAGDGFTKAQLRDLIGLGS